MKDSLGSGGANLIKVWRFTQRAGARKGGVVSVRFRMDLYTATRVSGYRAEVTTHLI